MCTCWRTCTWKSQPSRPPPRHTRALPTRWPRCAATSCRTTTTTLERSRSERWS
ncbi:hypothetical protein E2C01_083280 [Portunus trituberculatus]|uniref:Uncharacterized protein n=1 Tax=Portunus trituberculatus TaxID=210409 RepID=A0A5B7J1B9_PORTR|nr:hypothetical protein [Portunus trituberculatus]